MRLLHYTNGKDLDQRGEYEDYVVIQRDSRVPAPAEFGFSLHCETVLHDVGSLVDVPKVTSYDSDHLPVGNLRLGPFGLMGGHCCDGD